MTFKEEYRVYNEIIAPDRALMEEIKEAAREQEEKGQHKLVRAVRGVLTAAAVFVCVFVVIPVGAANVDAIYNIMYRISPELMQRYKPIQRSDEDCGIRMEVSTVYIYENEIRAYITLRDLESDRIDATTDLYDSYSINTPFGGYGGGGYRPVDFDEETGTATFSIVLGQFDGEDGEMQEIQGEKITFSLREFLSKKQEYDALEIPVSWEEVQEKPATMSLRIRGGSCPNMERGDENNPVARAKQLAPGEPQSIVEGIYLTGMGYIDGRLHIQTMVPNHLETDNHCELFLVDKEGNRRIYDYKINAFGVTKETETTDYQDCIFEVSLEELENYTLQGDFVSSGIHVKGNWSVTFPIE